jgi:hypothetical protein
MDDLSGIGEYFDRKVSAWSSRDGSVAAHLRKLGRDGLVTEFRSDPEFAVVSRYLERANDVQYAHDAGYSEFKSKVRESISGPSGVEPAAQKQVSELVVRASMLASGVSPRGLSLVKIAGALPRS